MRVATLALAATGLVIAIPALFTHSYLEARAVGILSEIEAQIEEATNELMKGRTSVVIAHRLVTARRANRILVLEDGELAETGTHAQLLARGGVYARLLERQLLEEEIEKEEAV